MYEIIHLLINLHYEVQLTVIKLDSKYGKSGNYTFILSLISRSECTVCVWCQSDRRVLIPCITSQNNPLSHSGKQYEMTLPLCSRGGGQQPRRLHAAAAQHLRRRHGGPRPRLRQLRRRGPQRAAVRGAGLGQRVRHPRQGRNPHLQGAGGRQQDGQYSRHAHDV